MARKSRKTAKAGAYLLSLSISVRLLISASRVEDKKRGNSIDNQQIFVLNDYIADKPEFKVYDTYIDNGLSVTTFRRPAFSADAFGYWRLGHIDCVIVKDLAEGLSATYRHLKHRLQYFSTHNVRFIAVTDQFDTVDADNPYGGMSEAAFENMINEAYALDIGRKIKAQQRQAMQDGEFVGVPRPLRLSQGPWKLSQAADRRGYRKGGSSDFHMGLRACWVE